MKNGNRIEVDYLTNFIFFLEKRTLRFPANLSTYSVFLTFLSITVTNWLTKQVIPHLILRHVLNTQIGQSSGLSSNQWSDMRTVSVYFRLYAKICFKNLSKRSLKKAKECKQSSNGMNHLLCIMMTKNASRLQKKQMKIIWDLQ